MSEHSDVLPVLPPVGTLPGAVRNSKWCYRFGYLAANVGLLVLMWSFRGSWLTDVHGNTQFGGAVPLLLVVLLAFVTYALVQGSNPGYVYADAQGGNATSTARWHTEDEAAGLMSLDGQPDVDDCDLELGSAGFDADAAEEAEGSPTADASSTRLERELAAAELMSGADSLMPGGAFRGADGTVRCIWCAVQQPVRAHHCRKCKMCVHGFDHHCNMLGTCIGEGNKLRFWLFLTAQTLALCVAVAYAHSCFYSAQSWGWGTWFGVNATALLQAILYYFLLGMVGSLWAMHSWLALVNGTTYEVLRGAKGTYYLAGSQLCDWPFSDGLAFNLRHFCCSSDALLAALMGRQWAPARWPDPRHHPVQRDSDDVMNNCWQNRYWSCC